MNAQNIKAALLNHVNDTLEITEYGHGFLVDMPLHYSDDDGITLFVEGTVGGYRISDHGTTAQRLQMSDIGLKSRQNQEHWRSAIGAMLANDIDPVEGHISMWAAEEDLGATLMEVAQACSRVDQMRWLRSGARPASYAERVTKRLQSALQDLTDVSARMSSHEAVRLRSGRTRQVTAALYADGRGDAPLIVQAMGGRDKQGREDALERTFHLFSLAEVPDDSRIAIARGSAETWEQAMIDEINQVGEVLFFDTDPVESSLRSHLIQASFA